jgi:hypothetical protein
VALVRSRAAERIASYTVAGRTGIGLGAEIPVITGCSVDRLRVGTDTGRGITDASVMALVEGNAYHWLSADAGARLTAIALRAEVAIVTRCSVG